MKQARTAKRGQAGYSLIELVIAMSVTAIVMVGLVGVVHAANQVVQAWQQRAYLAGAAALLPDRLHEDGERYAPCPGSAPGATLNLCLPGGEAVVIYRASGSCPCDVLRVFAPTGGQEVVARQVQQPPRFTTTCSRSGSVDTGALQVDHLRYPGDTVDEPPLVVTFEAPLRSCSG